MYALYKEVHPPTVVEHCASCNFFSGKETNLVVAGTTQLRVFRLIEPTEVIYQQFKVKRFVQDEIHFKESLEKF